MKNRMIKSILLSFCTVAIFLSGCKKDDDKLQTVNNPSAPSSISGNWEVTELKYNGTDNLHYTSVSSYSTICGFDVDGTTNLYFSLEYSFNSNSSYSHNTSGLFFYVSTSQTYETCSVVYIESTFQEAENGIWGFLDNQSKIELTSLPENTTITWDIVLRQNNLIKLERTYIDDLNGGISAHLEMTIQRIV